LFRLDELLTRCYCAYPAFTYHDRWIQPNLTPPHPARWTQSSTTQTQTFITLNAEGVSVLTQTRIHDGTPTQDTMSTYIHRITGRTSRPTRTITVVVVVVVAEAEEGTIPIKTTTTTTTTTITTATTTTTAITVTITTNAVHIAAGTSHATSTTVSRGTNSAYSLCRPSMPSSGGGTWSITTK